MKDQINKLVSEILHDLKQSPPDIPELAAAFRAMGVDGRSRAVAKRAVLRRWSEDITLSQDMRDYAQQQLDLLPDF